MAQVGVLAIRLQGWHRPCGAVGVGCQVFDGSCIGTVGQGSGWCRQHAHQQGHLKWSSCSCCMHVSAPVSGMQAGASGGWMLLLSPITSPSLSRSMTRTGMKGPPACRCKHQQTSTSKRQASKHMGSCRQALCRTEQDSTMGVLLYPPEPHPVWQEVRLRTPARLHQPQQPLRQLQYPMHAVQAMPTPPCFPHPGPTLHTAALRYRVHPATKHP